MLIITLLVLIGVFAYGLIQQLIFGQPWGDRPMSDTGLIIAGSATILFSAGMLYLFASLQLITEVRPEGLCIRFYPLHSKTIPYHSITSCEARTYRPVLEYGGWGIKYGPSGWAYNIVGTQGVQLVLESGKRILVGSQRAEELERAIKHYRGG